MNREILRAFGVDDSVQAEPFGHGHINDTYLIHTEPKTVLQRVNTNVFKDPVGLMGNVKAVTEYMRKIVEKRGGDTNREVLNLIPTIDGKDYYLTDDGQCYRMYQCIENSFSSEEGVSAETLYTCGKAFGAFQHDLSDFPAEKLVETIPHFHDTIDRLKKFRHAVDADVCDRAAAAKDEIAFVTAQEDTIRKIMDFYATLPLRVTHNDTKTNNVLLDATTGDILCVIDLDTVMPGYAANDFGDSVRFGASTAAEDEEDLSKVNFDMSLYESYKKGFLEGFGQSITEDEVRSLPMGAYLMTIEVGMRFLTDYLEGDTYFKISKPDHNLIRCRTQLKLAEQMKNTIL